MNKFILFASLFIVISSLCANSTDIKKVDDCKNNQLSDEEKKTLMLAAFIHLNLKEVLKLVFVSHIKKIKYSN